MKRFLSLALALVMVLSASGLLKLGAAASGDADSGASAETPAFSATADKADPAAGETVKITVSAKNIPVHSIGIRIVSMEGFEFSKGSWVSSAFKIAKVEDPDPDESEDWETPYVTSNMSPNGDVIDPAVSTYAGKSEYVIDGRIFTLTLKALSGSRSLLIEAVYKMLIGDDEISFVHYLPLFGAELPAEGRITTADRVGLLDGAKKAEIVLAAENFTLISLGVDAEFDSTFSFSKGNWISSTFEVPAVEEPEDDGDWISPILTNKMEQSGGIIAPAALAYAPEDGAQTVSGNIFKLTLDVNGTIDSPRLVVFTIRYSVDSDDDTRTFTIPVIIDKHTHEWEVESVVEPGCLTGGHTVFVCPGCGEHKTGEETAAVGHSYGEWTVTKEPTCTENGVKEKVCSRCGDVQTGTVVKLGHVYSYVTVAPTCTEMGYTTYTCDRCGDAYVGTTAAALGHDYGEWTVTKEPTCTEKGSKERTCTRCGVTDTAVISALGHNYTAVSTSANCTEQGYITHTCSRCGDVYTDTYTDPLGHAYTEQTVSPTCTGEGYVLHTCSRCGDNYKTNITPALGHDCAEWTVVTAPTCIKEGVEQSVCGRCGETLTRNVPVVSHSYGEWTVVTATSCTENGVKTRACTVCGDVQTEITYAYGHYFVFSGFEWEGYTAKAIYVCFHDDTHVCSYDATVTSEITLESTCEGEGVRTYTAEYDGNYGYKNEPVSAIGHSYVAWSVNTAPTEEAEGLRVRYCTVCKAVEEGVIPALSEANGYVKTVAVKPKMSAEGVMNWTHAEYGTFATAIPKLPSGLPELLDSNYLFYRAENVQYVLIKSALAELPECVVVRDTAGALCTAADQVFGHVINAEEDGKIYDTAVVLLLGDYSCDGKVTSFDAVLLLRHTLFPEKFPLNQPGDINRDGKVTSLDAVLLLRHTLFPEKFPLTYPD